MSTILEELRPDAVFCANDYMAAGAIKFLWEAGLRVPHAAKATLLSASCTP
jgi:DNA-binding LacI/PurR family transcriptional regulator